MSRTGSIKVRAECHSDDRNVEVSFDASRWLKAASGRDILRLAQCGWGGDYPADEVAIDEAERDETVAFMFKYLQHIKDDPLKKDLRGFECHVNADDALAWLRRNRPRLAKTAARIGEDPAAFDVKTMSFTG